MAKTDLTVEFVRSLFHYDPETGRLWRKQKKYCRLVDAKTNYGYLCAGAAGKNYLAHRLVWVWFYGAWPVMDVDHINGQKDDNRICNLRDVPRAMNVHNVRSARKNNRGSALGVSRHGKKGWRARIQHGDTVTHLGTFASAEEAAATYLAHKAKLHKGYVP